MSELGLELATESTIHHNRQPAFDFRWAQFDQTRQIQTGLLKLYKGAM